MEDRVKRIEKALDHFLPERKGSLSETVTDAMRYSLLNGGKRVRAVLTLAFCELCGGDALFVGGIELTVADILHNGAGEQVDVLQNHAEGTAEIRLLDLRDVDAVVADLSVRNVIEAVDKVCDGRFACARCADERDLLAGLCVKRDVMQDGLLRGITKIDVLKLYVTGELRIGDRAVLMRMLPCPKAGVLVGFGEHAVFLFGVDERDVALVLFALGIEQREDAGSACHSHDDGRDLLRDLADRHNEAAGELQERRDAAERHDTHAGEGQVRYACKCETAAKHGDAILIDEVARREAAK
jgi:hypothetical protein